MTGIAFTVQKNFCYNWLGISFTVYKISSLVSSSKMRIIVKNCLKYVGTFASHIAQGLAVLVWAFASLEYSSLSMMNIDYGRKFGGWIHLIKSFFPFWSVYDKMATRLSNNRV